MPSEIRDGHSAALGTPRRPFQGSARFSPTECARAEMAVGPLVPVGMRYSRAEFETQREVLCAWLRPWSGPKPDRDRAVRGEIAHCANRSGYTERRRRAGWRFFLHAAPVFLDRRAPQEMAHSLPSCIPRDRILDFAMVFRRGW